MIEDSIRETTTQLCGNPLLQLPSTIHKSKLLLIPPQRHCYGNSPGGIPDQVCAVGSQSIFCLFFFPSSSVHSLGFSAPLLFEPKSVLLFASPPPLKPPPRRHLKLLLTALHKLPPLSGTVFRGVKEDLSAKYFKDEEVVWWGPGAVCAWSWSTGYTFPQHMLLLEPH